MKSYVAFLTFCGLALSAIHVRADQFTVLKTASTYGVLAASTITSTGFTVVSGDLGLTGPSVTGFPPGIVTNGTMHIGDSQAQVALSDATDAFTYLFGMATTQIMTGQELAGRTLGTGVYVFATSAALNGAMTLDFKGASNANIVFLIGTSLTTSAGSSVTVVNQGIGDNVYYAVGTAATLGANTLFAGDMLAGTGITLGAGAGSNCGSLTAITGAVTMLSNSITKCSSTGSNVTSYADGLLETASPVPEPGTFSLLATGLIGTIGTLRQRSRR